MLVLSNLNDYNRFPLNHSIYAFSARKMLAGWPLYCAILLKRLWRSTQEAEGTGFENQQTCERAGVRIPPSPLIKNSSCELRFFLFFLKSVLSLTDKEIAFMQVREYTQNDIPQMIRIWNEIVEEGNAFPQEETLDEKTGAEFFGSQTRTAVAV